ncbi:MAG: glycine cleavage system protein H, partial [Firmicutes bacterium]|nr:glycine cleavage system protein H [Bacillota bacterium]
EELMDAPEKMNEDPYDAWLIKVENITEKGELLSAEEYIAFYESEEA